MKRKPNVVTGAAIALALMLFVLVGATLRRVSGQMRPQAPTAIAVGLVTDGPEIYDRAFNELSFMGILRARDELSITYQVYTSTSAYDYASNFERCAQDGMALCIGVGLLMADAISQSATLYPGVAFALVDYAWETPPPNLRGLTFAEDQAGYLAGTLAALMSDSGVVGAVGGMEIPPVQRFIAGYQNGARCAAPATTVLVTYTNTFVDPALGAQTAQEMLGAGADVIFGVAGATGNGAILTATQSGAWAIGVDVDQYRTVFEEGSVPGSDRLLSSALKRLDNGVFATIADVISGTFTSGTVLYTAAEEGVGLAPFHETDPLILMSARSRLSGVEQGLRAGWLDVYGPCVATLGVAADLSGPVAGLGWQEANAVQLAVDQANAAGGLTLGGVPYTLRLAVADDGCDPAQGPVAAQSLLDAGALAVVGHTCSGASLAAQAVYAAAGVPMISPSATRPDVTQQGYNTTFRVISHDGSPPMQLATYLRQWGNYQRAALVATAEQQWALDFYSDTFTGLGGVITGYRIVTDTADFMTVAADIKHNEQPDVIFYTDADPARAGLFSQAAHAVGMMDVPIGWSSRDSNTTSLAVYADAAGPAVEGDFVVMSQRPFWAMPGWTALASDYQAAGFPNVPDDPGYFGAFAYDAARILLDALNRAGTPGGARDAVAATAGYAGVVGWYAGFDRFGDVIPQWGWIERYRAGQWTAVYARPEFGAELHVCDSACDYTTIQAAVDAASDGDLIKVAAGTYSDLHGHAAPVGYYGPGVITQVVYLDKALTLRGGYSAADWDMPAPLANPTIIDAGGGGRALVIAGAATVEGFHLTGGDARDLRGSDRAGGSTDAGGGVFISSALPTLQNCRIYSNTAHQGGGGYVDRTAAFLYDNAIYSNTAHWGGGATLWDSDATLIGNTITGNTATKAGAPGPPDVFISAGGGLEIGNDGGVDSYPTLIGNTITGNSAEKHGGGLAVGNRVHATIHQNTISANSAITGGGLYLSGQDTEGDEVRITENVIAHNTATQDGGGMALWDSRPWIQSNDIFSNTAIAGGGIYAHGPGWGGDEDGGPALFGNTFTFNTASVNGGGMMLDFSAAAVIGNHFENNEAREGGALYLLLSNATVDRNAFKANVAERGGALGFQGGNARLYNNLIFENQATERGSALYTFGASPTFAHNTIARNTGGDGSAIYATYWEPFDQSWDMANTIIADHASGINASGAITIQLDHVLWHNTPVTITTDGTAAILAQNQLSGDPLFGDPASGDYHIGAASPALDAGLEMPEVFEDIDWQPRPMGLGCDIGADEAPGARLTVQAESPATVLLPGQTFTYSVALASDGVLTAPGTLLKFTLDPQQRAAALTPAGLCLVAGEWGETITCPLGDLPPGATWSLEITAQVAPTVPPAQGMWSAAEALAEATLLRWSDVKTISRARLTYPLSYELGSLDVNRKAADMNALTLLAQLMEAPYRYDANGVLIPAGATGTTVSPDGRVYTITLRADALWSDGVPVTAQHYADSVLRMLNPAIGADYAFVLYPIQGAWEFNSGETTDPATVGVAAVDAHTLRFTLHSPAAFFPSVLATSAMYPVRLDAVDTQPFIGNGPYNLTEWVYGQWFLLDKNPLYHSAAEVVIPQILLPIIPQESQVAAYAAGLLDVSEIPGSAMGYVLNDPTLSNELRSAPWPGLLYLGLNTVLTPTNDLAVRQALASAVDRDALLAVLNTPWREAATSVIPPGIGGYQNGAVGYPFNLTQAQTYLAQAGYPGGAGFPGVELWATESARPLAEAVAADWRSGLGISVTVVYQENYGPLRECRAAPGECAYHAYRLGWIVDYADASNLLKDLFHPDAGNQYTGWDSARYRELMTLQLSELDPAQRLAYLQEADRILVQDAAAIIPLHFLDRVFLIKPHLTYEYPTIGGPRLMTWRTFGAALPCYARVASLPGITYNDLQTAIDAAPPGDTLKVAGTCSAVHSRPADLALTGVVTQVAYIDKSLALQGGYTTTNWLHPDPAANPTTLDASDQGRALYITGAVAVTLEGFRITGGNATGLGGVPWGWDAGGGVYAISATVTLNDNRLEGNYSPDLGGGVFLRDGGATLNRNAISANHAGWGGGALFWQSHARLNGNTIVANAATTAGGGIAAWGYDLTLNGDTLMDNMTSGDGGGLAGGAAITLLNTLVAHNQAERGGGLYVDGMGHLVHTTLVGNIGSDGSSLYVTTDPLGVHSTVALTNTILAQSNVGISVTGGNTVTVNGILWYATPVTVSQALTAVVEIRNQMTGDPSFAADGYHLRIGSPAIDAGVPAGLARDIDGDPRPYGNGYDLGADEAPYVNVDPQSGATLVYTATQGTTTTVTIPPAAVSETVTIVFTRMEEGEEIPPELVSGEMGFGLEAFLGETPVATGFVFSAPVTVTLGYGDADVAGMDEASLKLYRYVCVYGESLELCAWEVIGARPGEGQMLDTENNVLTAWLVGFSKFRGLGASFQPVWELAKTYAGNRVAGTAITYTLNVTNTGGADATAVTLEDVVPEHITWSSGGTFESGVARWYFEAITASGGTVGQFSAVLPCTASLAIVNDDYRVTGSAQGVTSTVGPPVSFAVAAPTIAVSVTMTPTAPVAGDTVTFTAESATNGTPLTYQWSVGGSGLTATQTYPISGTYTLTFTATDGCGYYGVKMVNVGVGVKGYLIYMPLVMR